MCETFRTMPKPTIAVIEGRAGGGGSELALSCDMRFATPGAILSQPEVALGIIPGGGGTQRLARTVGASRAKEMCLTGRQVKADEALRIGLADEVVAPDELHDRALALPIEPLPRSPGSEPELHRRRAEYPLQRQLA